MRRGCVLLIAAGLLGGCAPGDDPISRMDRFFDRIDPPAPPPVAVTPYYAGPYDRNGRIVTGPGYAPAYPPYTIPER